MVGGAAVPVSVPEPRMASIRERLMIRPPSGTAPAAIPVREP